MLILLLTLVLYDIEYFVCAICFLAGAIFPKLAKSLLLSFDKCENATHLFFFFCSVYPNGFPILFAKDPRQKYQGGRSTRIPWALQLAGIF